MVSLEKQEHPYIVVTTLLHVAPNKWQFSCAAALNIFTFYMQQRLKEKTNEAAAPITIVKISGKFQSQNQNSAQCFLLL